MRNQGTSLRRPVGAIPVAVVACLFVASAAFACDKHKKAKALAKTAPTCNVIDVTPTVSAGAVPRAYAAVGVASTVTVGVAPTVTADVLPRAYVTGVVPRSYAVLAGDRDEDRLNDRIEQLEARLAELMNRLEQLSGHLEHAAPRHHDGRSEGHSGHRVPMVPMPAMPPMPVMPAMPPMPHNNMDEEEIGEWQEQWQERMGEWREHQSEMMDEWRERFGDMRDNQRDQAEHWKDWARQWQDRGREMGERAREHAHEHAGRVRARSERSRERAHEHAERARARDGRSRERAGRRSSAGRGEGRARSDSSGGVVYNVTGKHADMLFNLLAPSDVKVIVSRAGDRIAVQGNRREHAVLDGFCQLAAWIDRDEVFQEMREGGSEARTYTVGPERAETLYKIFAPNAVKVFVSRAGADAVSVNGTDREHDVIADFLKLIHFDASAEPKHRKERKVQKRQNRRAPKPDKKASARDRVVYDLQGEDANHLFNILAPSDVKVMVSRDGGRIAVQGSKKEHQTLNAFCQLAGWIDRDEVFEKMREGETSSKVYSVGEERAEMLYEILAPNDVKVVVSRVSSEAVSVRGTNREHKAMKRFLKLANWD